MALLLVFMVIMGILLMKAQPYAIAQVQREKEAELIFRGEAIARAIRVYQLRTGGYPPSLGSLTELRPRIIRRVYEEPMSKDGEWRKIYQVQPGVTGSTAGLPIIGVASTSDAQGYRKYKGRELYSDWIFSATDTVLGMPQGAQVPPVPQLPTGTGKDAQPPSSPPAGDKK
ncbi:MAG: type II secretion system protein [Acidobacteria bacterium]|nr:type II secretion system protein [Acidobacteriota bacterium]